MFIKNKYFAPAVFIIASMGFLPTAFSATLAGTVLAVNGNVKAQGPSGNRTLNRGSQIFSGDEITTAANSGVQIRFSDNGLVALRANADYRVDNYEFKGKDDKNAALNSTIVKGKMLALTGAITQENPNGYKVKSKLATISVTGTDFDTEIPANSQYQLVHVSHGTVDFTAPGGSIAVGDNGQFNSAIVTEQNGVPIGVSNLPGVSTGHVDEEEHENTHEDEHEDIHEEDIHEEDILNFSYDRADLTSFFSSFEPGLDEEADEHDLGEAEEDMEEDEFFPEDLH